jgi:nucleotide-binding universal stress UspA family protein
MVKKIVIAYDGSEPAMRAFRFALELAKFYSAPAIVLSVAQLPEPATMVESSALLEAATEHFEADFAKLRKEAETAGVSLESRVVVGHVAEQIVHQAAAEQADLIVMGHRGKSRIARWLLGSVSKRVLSYASCSVLIVR